MIYEVTPWQQSLSSLAPLGYFYIRGLQAPVKSFQHDIYESLLVSYSIRYRLMQVGSVVEIFRSSDKVKVGNVLGKILC